MERVGITGASRAMLPDMKHSELAERHELVAGELVEKASPSFEHGDAQFSIAICLASYRGKGGADRPGGWWFGTEVEIELEPDKEVYLPDVAGWRIERVPIRPSGRPIRIAPDWVCEILSPSTSGRDLGHKRSVYYRAHVTHYWVIAPVDQALFVYRWREDGYGLVLAAGADDVVRAEPFEGVEIRVGKMFGQS